MKKNYIVCEDNLAHLKTLETESVDLIYCDPPFNTGRDFGEGVGGYSDKSSDLPEETIPAEEFAWLLQIATPNELLYLASLIPRIVEIERILKDTGAFYYHCDWHTSHLIRMVINQIFGRNKFRSEIAWKYQISMPYNTIEHRWKSDYDVILFYAKKDHAFTQQYQAITLCLLMIC